MRRGQGRHRGRRGESRRDDRADHVNAAAEQASAGLEGEMRTNALLLLSVPIVALFLLGETVALSLQHEFLGAAAFGGLTVAAVLIAIARLRWLARTRRWPPVMPWAFIPRPTPSKPPHWLDRRSQHVDSPAPPLG